ncbi:hypothetical protein D3C72_1222970 [compost metagenome]
MHFDFAAVAFEVHVVHGGGHLFHGGPGAAVVLDGFFVAGFQTLHRLHHVVDRIDRVRARLVVEFLHEGLVLRVVLGFRVQEVVVAARADVDAFGQGVAQAFQRAFCQGQHEGGVLEQVALRGLAHEVVQVAAPRGGYDDVGAQGLQAADFGGEVGGAELGEHLGHDLDVGLELLQRGQEDVARIAAPGVVLVDDGDGLEVGFHLHQVQHLGDHFGGGVGLGTHHVLVLLAFQGFFRAAVPHHVQHFQVFGDGGHDVAVAAGNGGQHHAGAAFGQTAVFGQQLFTAAAFVDVAGHELHAVDAACRVDVLDEDFGRVAGGHAEHRGRARQEGRDADVQFLGLVGGAGQGREAGQQCGA